MYLKINTNATPTILVSIRTNELVTSTKFNFSEVETERLFRAFRLQPYEEWQNVEEFKIF